MTQFFSKMEKNLDTKFSYSKSNIECILSLNKVPEHTPKQIEAQTESLKRLSAFLKANPNAILVQDNESYFPLSAQNFVSDVFIVYARNIEQYQHKNQRNIPNLTKCKE